MKSTHMFIALLHLKMILPYLPIGYVNICVCVICFICYIYMCVCVCLIYVVIYVIYVKYIHTIYNTLCFP
jgi:hypothetical protein